jgi:cell division transport system permease protein
MSLAAVTITFVTLIALGSALVVTRTLGYIAHELEAQVQVVVYLKDGLGAPDVSTAQATLAALPGVTGVRYVSKGQALEQLRRSVGGGTEFRDLGARNPLPASFVVTADGAGRLREIASEASGLPWTESVNYGAETVARLTALTQTVRGFGAATGGVLALIALVVISSTIRLTVYARRAEIEVMRLVGATAWFVRWPFVVEGAVTGACGALAAFAIVAGAYGVVAHGAEASVPFLPLPGAQEVAFDLSWKLLLWGVVIGVAGSLLAVRRYVRV